ncbi:vitamin K-dependent protein C-like [Condylostylus longicornis]|uniref:vitamin K-dependent protein C-like n=1 Tax=Condylostylus longicornis TaxID=2530218 RepID=UPI00244DC15B|nr:vitamin K-dependent protein C-like [Condylostylus longicornis]
MIDVKVDNTNNLCGQRKKFHKTLIQNGYDVQPGEYPWHAAIFLRKESDSPNTDYICGGSLVSKSTVITAGHCVHENYHIIISQRFLVKLGLHNRLLASSNTQELRVYEILVPPIFDVKSSKNDIALLKLSNYVQFNDYIKPVCLWPAKYIELNSIVGKTGMVIGWGLDEKSQLSNILKAAKMPVISQINCLESNRAFFGEHLSVNNYCAGYRNGTSVCNGDSGGGMVFEINGLFYLRGIVSLAEAIPEINQCNPREYVLFTDAAKFLDFIQNNI